MFSILSPMMSKKEIEFQDLSKRTRRKIRHPKGRKKKKSESVLGRGFEM